MGTDGLGKTYGDRQAVVRQGETGDCMYAIQNGRVEVVRETDGGEVRVAVLEEGDIFGEMAIFEKEVRSATVRALGEARVLSIDKRTFLRRVQEDPSLLPRLPGEPGPHGKAWVCTPDQPPPDPRGPCPCGSGKRYRKCCMPR